MRRTSCGSGVPCVSCSSDLDVIAIGDQQARTLRDGVLEDVRAVVRCDDELARLVRVVDRNATSGLGDRRTTLGLTCLEELHDARKTVRDVVSGHTTGVEGTHGQLRAGLTDRLGRDGTDGLTDVDELAGRERTAVALGTRTGLGLTGQDGADLDLLDTFSDQARDLDVAQLAAAGMSTLPLASVTSPAAVRE